MGLHLGRAERVLVVWLCGALLVGSALLLWQQWRIHQARRELNAYLAQRVVPWAEDDPGAGDPTSAQTAGESSGQGQGRDPAALGEAGEAEPARGHDEEKAAQGDRLLQVHVAGAVVSPGVYQLPVGARAVDGVEAAGGARPEADLDKINLAAPLEDGQQLYVPRRGEEAPQPQAGSSGSGSRQQGQQQAGATRINVNQAGVDALQQVPGIGPVLAARIVAYRQAHGPFQRVEDLTRVQGIGPRSLENMRLYIYVGGSP